MSRRADARRRDRRAARRELRKRTQPPREGKCERTGKVRWVGREAAVEALLNLAGGRPYPCEFCGSWHVSSQPRRGPMR